MGYIVLDMINNDSDHYKSLEDVKAGLIDGVGYWDEKEYNDEVDSINSITNDSELHNWLRKRDCKLTVC